MHAMDPDLRDAYEQIILDHNAHPPHYHRLASPTHTAEGYNPVCGDHYHVELQIGAGRIVAAGFTGHGCALSKASASIMTAMLTGRTTAEALALFDRFHALITAPELPGDTAGLGELMALSGVRQYPGRVKCVNLAWHAFRAALQEAGPVSTE